MRFISNVIHLHICTWGHTYNHWARVQETTCTIVCSVLQIAAACCSVLQLGAEYNLYDYSEEAISPPYLYGDLHDSMVHCDEFVWQCLRIVAACCSLLQWGAEYNLYD